MTPAELKTSIIKLGLQGKLVSQIPSEGTGQDLLRDIEFLRKKSSQKKEKPFPSIDDDDVPFDIPTVWTWAYIGQLFSHNTGKALNSSDCDGRPLEYITTSNVYWDSFVLDKLKTMLFTKDEESRCTVQKGDLLVLEGGDVGRSAIWNYDFPMRIQNHIHRLRPYGEVSIKFFYYVFFYYKASGRIAGKGIGIQGLSTGVLHNLIVPLPPLHEQKRIVEKIESLMPLVDEYERIWNKLEALNKNIMVALEKSILQAAFAGKIVPQIAEEGTGDEAFQQIKNWKKHLCSKNRKIPFEIKDTEIPFEIPPTWRWCRLNDIVYNRGQQIPTSRFSYIDIGSIDNKRKKLNDTDNVLEAQNAPSRARKVVGYGDILYSTVRPYLHNICVVDRNFSYPPIASTGFAVLTPYPGLLNEYLFYYLCSPGFDAYVNASDNSKGVAYPAINDDRLYRALVPLPPLDEQKRIVDKIKSLMSLINQMEFDKKEA